jgi:hypothetical protein
MLLFAQFSGGVCPTEPMGRLVSVVPMMTVCHALTCNPLSSIKACTHVIELCPGSAKAYYRRAQVAGGPVIGVV